MNRIVRVVPDVPTFAVDDGFLYTTDPGTAVAVGSTVRVPLGGRTVRGVVVAVGEGDPTGLKPVKAVSPSLPQFDEPHLALHRWLAHHYVAPLAAFLRAAAPPNLPRSARPVPEPVRGPGGRRHITTDDAMGAAREIVSSTDGSVLLVAPTAVEAEAVAAGLPPGRRSVVVTGRGSAAAETTAWVTARTSPGVVVVGTPRVAAWPVAGLATVVCLDDGRRGHKARQTPTVHTRTVLNQRARFEGVSTVTTGVVPAPESLAIGADVPTGPRAWARVEVVDRRDDPPGTGPLSRTAQVAIQAAVRSGSTVAVFTHRTGYAPAFRCTRCRGLRTCTACSTRATATAWCARCGAPLGECASCGGAAFEPLGAAAGVLVDRLRGLVDGRLVSLGPGRAVSVVTERDLPALDRVDLAVAVDADALIGGPSYRSEEDGIRLLARLGAKVRRAPGSRLIVQTSRPEHRGIEVLRRGRADEWLAGELTRRADLGYPPIGELAVIEVRGADATALETLATDRVAVLGPVPHGAGLRWLVQGPDLNEARGRLRVIARRLRDAGAEVRIDMDPIDL